MSISPEQLMNVVVNAVEDKKAMNVTTLNLTGISLVSDYYIICHGNSETQVQAIASEAKKQAEKKRGHRTGRRRLRYC